MYSAKYNDLQQLVAALGEDVAKADNGNKAARCGCAKGFSA